MNRKVKPPEPEWPDEHRCEKCGARVYRVTSHDGDDVVLDVDELEIVTSGPSELWWRPRRKEFRHAALKRQGGHKLLDPELFWGWESLGEGPEWKWFSMRMGLDEAVAGNAALHSEHHLTCEAVSVAAVLAKISNIPLTGSAAGNMQAKRRLTRLTAPAALPEQLPEQETAEAVDSSPHPPATEPAARAAGPARQLALF